MIRQLKEDLKRALREAFALPARDVDRFTEGFAREFARKHGGDDRYIAKGSRRQRRQEALQMFNGNNHDDVCAAVGISRATLYRYLQEQTDAQEE